MPQPTSPACPTCGQSDLVFKVSELYARLQEKAQHSPAQPEPTAGSAVHNETTAENVSSSNRLDANLRKQLAPPRQPEFKGSLNCAGTLFMLFALLAITGILFGYTAGIKGGYSQWLTIFYGSLILLIPFVYLTIRYTRKFLREQHAIQSKYEIEADAWQKSMQKWDGLYFCQRDHCIFDPAVNEVMDPADLKTYLKEV